jgi:hypothetical protein
VPSLWVIVFLAAPARSGGTVLDVPFGYAWRFQRTAARGISPSCTFDAVHTASECQGLEHDPNRFSADDCRIACCYKPECKVWYVNHSVIPHCYHGYVGSKCSSTSSTSSSTSHEWANATGGYRSATTPIPSTGYPEAGGNGFPDQAWPLVNTPHDSVIGTDAYNPNVTNPTHAYLNRTVSWYRKKFYMPLQWKQENSLVQIEFAGVFHYAQVWLNGVLIGSGGDGYNGFIARIDNCSAAKWSDMPTSTSARAAGDSKALNVVSVRADASFGSGHWYEGGGIFR